ARPHQGRLHPEHLRVSPAPRGRPGPRHRARGAGGGRARRAGGGTAAAPGGRRHRGPLPLRRSQGADGCRRAEVRLEDRRRDLRRVLPLLSAVRGPRLPQGDGRPQPLRSRLDHVPGRVPAGPHPVPSRPDLHLEPRRAGRRGRARGARQRAVQLRHELHGPARGGRAGQRQRRPAGRRPDRRPPLPRGHDPRRRGGGGAGGGRDGRAALEGRAGGLSRGKTMAFGWGIVSTGRHPDIKIAPAMAAADGAELVAVCSRDQQRAEAFAHKHRARAAYRRLGDLLADSRVDGVFVASPNALHAEHVIQAAQAGKHVLCEKPMATTIADALQMLKACRRAGVTLGVAFNLRQHPAYRRARDLVAAGTLGRVVLAQAQWAFGVRGLDGPPPRTPLTQWWDTPELIGGASTMMGTGVHSVDLLRFVLGAEVDEITAVTDGQTAARPLEQLACLTLRFGNGTLGQVVASRLLPDSRNDFRVYGIRGLIAGHHSMWEARTGRFEITSDTVNETADYPEALLPNYVAEIEDFQR